MSTDPAKRIAQPEADSATLKARLNVMAAQRNEAMDRAVISKAAADLQVEQLEAQLRHLAGELQRAGAEVKKLKEELEAAKKPAETPAVPNGHTEEACPQA